MIKCGIIYTYYNYYVCIMDFICFGEYVSGVHNNIVSFKKNFIMYWTLQIVGAAMLLSSFAGCFYASGIRILFLIFFAVIGFVLILWGLKEERESRGRRW